MSTDQVAALMTSVLQGNSARNARLAMSAPSAEAMERDPAWGYGPFPPGMPLPPQAINQARRDTRRPQPRLYEFEVAQNIQIGQRDRLTPWHILRDAADQPLFRKCINRRKSICDLDFVVTVDPKAIASRQDHKNDPREAVDIAGALRRQFTAEIARASDWFEEPDRKNGQDWAQWTSALMEAHLVYDAVAVYPRMSLNGVDLYSLEVLDGSTMKPIIDDYGGRPLPPMPAWQQILYGYPRGEWTSAMDLPPDTKPGEIFAADEMVYERRVARPWTRYGLPPTEVALIDGLLWSRRFGWILGEYTEGVQPASFLTNKGDVEWSPELNADYERALNDRLSGNTAERMRYKLLPVGIEPVQSVEHAERYRSEYDLFIIKLVAGDFNMPITEIGFTETGALGSSFHEGNQDILNRQSRIPDAQWLSKMATRMARRYLRMPKELRVWILGLESEDEAAVDQVAENRVRTGRMTLNEDRARRGLAPYDFREADMPQQMTDRGVVYLEGASAVAPPGTLVMPAHANQPAVPQPGTTPGSATAGGVTRAGAGIPAGTAVKAGPPAATPGQVRQQLLDDYPPKALGWLGDAQWFGPVEVPLALVDFSDEKTWNAYREMGRVGKFAEKIKRKAAKGAHINPVILVQVPGKKTFDVVDGHHRSLAYEDVKQPVWAYIGKVNAKTGPWDEMHTLQYKTTHPGASQYATKGAVPASAEVRAAEMAALRRWLARNPRPSRPFTCNVLKQADLADLASDPRVLPADGTPKGSAGAGPAGTPTRR